MRVIYLDDLRKRNINYHQAHIYKMERLGRFPRSFQLTEGGRRCWDEADVDAWMEQRKATPKVDTRHQPKRRRLRVVGG